MYVRLMVRGHMESALTAYVREHPDSLAFALSPRALYELLPPHGVPWDESVRCQLLEVLRIAAERPGTVPGWRIERDASKPGRFVCVRLSASRALDDLASTA